MKEEDETILHIPKTMLDGNDAAISAFNIHHYADVDEMKRTSFFLLCVLYVIDEIGGANARDIYDCLD